MPSTSEKAAKPSADIYSLSRLGPWKRTNGIDGGEVFALYEKDSLVFSGTSRIGLFRQGFFWVLDANGNRQFDGTGAGQDLAFAFGGLMGDVPVIGKWRENAEDTEMFG